MLSRILIILIAAIAALIGILHLLALEFYLYWTLWWFDILLHFLGGAWVALTAFWFFFCAHVMPRISRTTTTVVVSMLCVTLAVGVAWEIFEYVLGVYDSPNYVFDTATDIVMDALGSLAASLVVLRSRFQAVLE